MDSKRQRMSGRLSWLACVLLVTLMLTGVLVGCSSQAGTAPTPTVVTTPSTLQTLTLTAIDYSYTMPKNTTLRAGLIDLKLVNNGTQAHQAQFARLNPGVTSTQVVNTLIVDKQEEQAFTLLTFVGGSDTIAPGDGQETVLNLPAGSYALLCLVTGSDGLPHVDKGMIQFLTVAAAQETQPAPQTSGEIDMRDNGYSLPNALMQTAPATFQVVNKGTRPHELNIVRLAAGKSIADITAFFKNPSGPPPFEEYGGMATLAPGDAGWVLVHLEVGNYAVFSVVPDPVSGVFQLTQGLLTAFTVQ